MDIKISLSTSIKGLLKDYKADRLQKIIKVFIQSISKIQQKKSNLLHK